MKTKSPEVFITCKNCGIMRALPKWSYDERIARSKSGNLFCSFKCARDFNSTTHGERLRKRN